MRYIYGLFRDTDHQLIYVGITGNPAQRMAGHRKSTLRGATGYHYMEILESGEDLTIEDENFWISYMAGLGCQLRNRIGVRYGKRETSSRSELETLMKRIALRPERIAVKCDLPLDTVWLAIKGLPIGTQRTEVINRFFSRKQFRDKGINFKIQEATP